MAPSPRPAAPTLTLAGTTDNAGLGLIVNGGFVILAKNSSTTPAVHAINGNLTINDAVVQLGGTGGDQIADNSNVMVTAAGSFDLHGKNETVNQIALSPDGSGNQSSLANLGSSTSTFGGSVVLMGASIIAASSGNLVVSGVVSGTGPLTILGNDTVTLNGVNTYTGGTVVSGGAVQLGTSTALGSTSGAVSVAGTLDLNGQAVGAYAVSLSGAGVGGNGGSSTVVPPPRAWQGRSPPRSRITRWEEAAISI